MISGKRYHIVSTVVPGIWNKPREMVLTYVTEGEKEYVFSARPHAGTQEIPKDQVAHITETTRPIMLPRIFRG